MNVPQRKIVNLLKMSFFAHQFLLVFVYLTSGPRQLFFFQCGPEMPKVWTPNSKHMCFPPRVSAGRIESFPLPTDQQRRGAPFGPFFFLEWPQCCSHQFGAQFSFHNLPKFLSIVMWLLQTSLLELWDTSNSREEQTSHLLPPLTHCLLSQNSRPKTPP